MKKYENRNYYKSLNKVRVKHVTCDKQYKNIKIKLVKNK